eukprot:11227877-Lingulodinium_polyedra.AAC.1
MRGRVLWLLRRSAGVAISVSGVTARRAARRSPRPRWLWCSCALCAFAVRLRSSEVCGAKTLLDSASRI